MSDGQRATREPNVEPEPFGYVPVEELEELEAEQRATLRLPKEEEVDPDSPF
jgi:hypothetical protein